MFALVKCEFIDAKIVNSYMAEILAEFKQSNYSRLLLKKEIPAVMEIHDYGVVARTLIDAGGQGMKIAVVDEFPDHAKVNQRGADKARKEGLNIKFFESVPPAAHWLWVG